MGCMVTLVWSSFCSPNLTLPKSLLDLWLTSNWLAANTPSRFPVSSAMAQGNGGDEMEVGALTLGARNSCLEPHATGVEESFSYK